MLGFCFSSATQCYGLLLYVLALLTHAGYVTDYNVVLLLRRKTLESETGCNI